MLILQEKGDVALKIRFLPEGGFHSRGAFIEYEGDEPTGDEPEYGRSAQLSFDILCDQMEIRTIASVVNEYDETENSDRPMTTLISGKGTIQPARWGRFSLSLFGNKRAHHEVSLTIRSNEIGEAVSFGGLFMEPDLDVEGWDEFYLEINVHTSRFQALVSELSEPGAILRAHVDTSKFPNFFAEWSPAISEGRSIKFLDSKKNVENAEDIPDDFWLGAEERKKMLSSVDHAPVDIGVIRPLKASYQAANQKDRLDLDDESALASPEANDEHDLCIERNNALLAQVDAIALLTGQVRQTGRWVALCFVVLIIAVLAK